MKRILLASALASTIGSTNAQSYGNWTVFEGNEKGTFIASTMNDSGGSLSKGCSADKQVCVWVTIGSAKCKKGSEYPGLMNSESGATPITLICQSDADSPSLTIKEFDAIDNAVKSSSMLGIAIPLQDGAFRVVRFNLKGAASAIAEIERRAIAAGKAATRDLNL